MKYIEVVAPQGNADTVRALAESVQAYDIRLGVVGEDGLQQMRLLLGPGDDVSFVKFHVARRRRSQCCSHNRKVAIQY